MISLITMQRYVKPLTPPIASIYTSIYNIYLGAKSPPPYPSPTLDGWGKMNKQNGST